VALVATACGGGDDPADETTDTDTSTGTEGEADGGDGGGDGEMATGVGVTEEPCPDATNPDNGCIYLGVLSDLTEGPFAALAVPITNAQQAFWARVNDEGGIGGFDVDIDTYTRDNKYNPEVHNQLYQEIKPEILAIAQTLGSPTTAAVLDDMKANNVVGAPASWTSLWEYEEVILESGNPYCVESMNVLDWLSENRTAAETVMAVHYPGDYGEDGAAGAKIWADEQGAEFINVEQVPKGLGGTTTGAVQAIVSQDPDVVIVATAPTELAEIVGGAVSQGYEGQFVGNGPSWNPALLQSPAAEALTAQYLLAGPWPSYSADTPGHQAMREWLENLHGEVQGNDGYTSGWAWSYPMKAALEAAAESGDLTREGLVAAISTLSAVDYEGMLPESAGNFTGDPNEQITRTTVISEPDAEAPAGVTELGEGFYSGPTADGYQFEGPCYQSVELG
jgi:ABC-type branched-subunit amino acid transport system substrate-binding protein